MTERKQWVDGMKNAVTLENPSEKCASFSDSESKKIDDYAKKCGKQENQVVVNITEAPINDTHKRMNITVFAPNKSEVVLQDYAHSTYEQTMHNFEDLKMDGELDLSGLTNAASAAKKAASATITAAKSAATKAKEVVTRTGTSPESKPLAVADDKPSPTATDPATSPPHTDEENIAIIKSYMERNNDYIDQLEDEMTPKEKDDLSKMRKEIDDLLRTLETKSSPSSSKQTGGNDVNNTSGNDVKNTSAKRNKAQHKYNDARDEITGLQNTNITPAVANKANDNLQKSYDDLKNATNS